MKKISRFHEDHKNNPIVVNQVENLNYQIIVFAIIVFLKDKDLFVNFWDDTFLDIQGQTEDLLYVS